MSGDKSVYRCPSLRYSPMNQKTRYFIYARKSSEGRDRQMLSIESQLSELSRIVERDNLCVAHTYKESKSAHVANNRPVFNEMIKRIRKGEANGIIAWHVNRITRNPFETGIVQQMLQDGQITSIVTPGRHFRTEDNALFFSIEASEANQYSRDLSTNVKRGLNQKYQMGQPPSIAPLGFLNTKLNIRGANKVIVDPERWSIVRKGFEMILSGAYTVAQALDVLNNEYGLRTKPGEVRGGRPLSKSGFYRMLTDPFYYGYFYRKGILYKGAYKPVITVEEFDQIQVILGRNGRPRPKRHEFAFTGLITCGVCGSAITGSEKQKILKSTGELKSYTLYHCTHRKKGAAECPERAFIPAKLIEQQIISELETYEIKPLFKEWAMRVIRENANDEFDVQKSIIDEQAKQEARLLQELDSLVDLRIAGSISEEKYLEKKAQREEQLIRVRSAITSLSDRNGNWVELFEKKLTFVENLVTRFVTTDVHTKKKICYDFGWNWVLKEKKLFISKQEWLEPFRKCKKRVESVLQRLELKNSAFNQGRNVPFDLIRPLMCDLVDEVRTTLDVNKHIV